MLTPLWVCPDGCPVDVLINIHFLRKDILQNVCFKLHFHNLNQQSLINLCLIIVRLLYDI